MLGGLLQYLQLRRVFLLETQTYAIGRDMDDSDRNTDAIGWPADQHGGLDVGLLAKDGFELARATGVIQRK